MTKKSAPKGKVSQSADGKTWVMPEAKPKPEKKGKKAASKAPVAKTTKRQPALLVLGEKMPKFMTATYKGAVHNATVLADGKIYLKDIDQTFNSPSRAGKAVTGKEVDGWTFWSYQKEDGTLEKIDALRQKTAQLPRTPGDHT